MFKILLQLSTQKEQNNNFNKNKMNRNPLKKKKKKKKKKKMSKNWVHKLKLKNLKRLILMPYHPV